MLFTIFVFILAAALPALLSALCATKKKPAGRPFEDDDDSTCIYTIQRIDMSREEGTPVEMGLFGMEPKAFIEKYIKEYTVMIFAKSTCPEWARAEAAIATYSDHFAVCYIDIQPNCTKEEANKEMQSQLEEHLSTLTGGQLVSPCVFYEGKYLGDADKIVAMKESGDLKKIFIKPEAL